MPISGLSPLTPLPPLAPLSVAPPTENQPTGATGFGAVLNGLLDGNRQADAAADAAITSLATGEAQDLHTVSMAVAQADLSFRLILELRNRLADALKEVTRMQM
jgi:flagellar hook-basal body complex protein FliE